MKDNPEFVKSYDPAGRLVFATTPSNTFFEMFEHVVQLTGRKIPKMLVSMYYLRSAKAGDNLRRVRAMCDHLFVDSGVFSFRSKILADEGVFFRTAYWTLDSNTKQLILNAGLKNKGIFDEFAGEYCEFLKKYGDMIDVAIDLDVEQFLGLDVADEYYDQLTSFFPVEKIMRVWHSHGRDWDDWKEWCNSGKYRWLALEGPDQHNRSVDMYNQFVSYAHLHYVNVHILAVTTLQFMKQVILDTCDSSTYTVGGRYARLLMPNGRDVLVGKRYKLYYANHIDNLSEVERDGVLKIIDYLGFTVDELNESHNMRCLFNIIMFLMYYDKAPLVDTFKLSVF